MLQQFLSIFCVALKQRARVEAIKEGVLNVSCSDLILSSCANMLACLNRLFKCTMPQEDDISEIELHGILEFRSSYFLRAGSVANLKRLLNIARHALLLTDKIGIFLRCTQWLNAYIWQSVCILEVGNVTLCYVTKGTAVESTCSLVILGQPQIAWLRIQDSEVLKGHNESEVSYIDVRDV